MGDDGDRISEAEAASLLQWWVDAGVDQAVAEQPRNWLRPAPATPPAEPVPPDQGAGPLPATLESFHQWLATSADLPLAEPGARRVAPHGPAGAAIMLVSEAPDLADAAEGRPLGGDSWKLVERMLEALGIASPSAYSAALAYVHVPAARLGGDQLERCAALLRHHIRLVAPKRLLLLGDGPARALLGQPLITARGRLHRIGDIPAVVTAHPRFLIPRPNAKMLAWQDLLRLPDEGDE